MAVQCANCGEELLGAVNRCWRCGQTLVAHAGPVDLPPVRRSPVVGPLDRPPGASIEAVLVEDAAQAPASGIRRGSPFAGGANAPAKTAVPFMQPSASSVPRRSFQVAPRVAAAASIAMGLIGIGVSFVFSPGALLIAIAGIGFGIWGLYSPNRTLGVFGLVLCCVALALSAFLLTVELYIYVYGISPFAAPAPPMTTE